MLQAKRIKKAAFPKLNPGFSKIKLQIGIDANSKRVWTSANNLRFFAGYAAKERPPFGATESVFEQPELAAWIEQSSPSSPSALCPDRAKNRKEVSHGGCGGHGGILAEG
jgi:hypothetical protein